MIAIDFSDVKKEDCIVKKIPSGVQLTGCRTVILQSVLNAVKAHGRSSAEKEVCGAFAGRLCWDNGAYLLIDSSVEVNQTGDTAFTTETWNCIQYEMTKNCPDKKIVGWYHTHPGFGVFLSNMDFFIHKTFFNDPHQIFYVFDPQSETDGFYFWSEDQLSKGIIAVIPDEEPVNKTPVPASSHVEVYREPVTEEKPVGRKILSAGIAITFLLIFAGLIGICTMLRDKLDDLQKDNARLKAELNVAAGVRNGTGKISLDTSKREKESMDTAKKIASLQKQLADAEKKQKAAAATIGKLEQSGLAKDAQVNQEQAKTAQKVQEIKVLSEKLKQGAAREEQYKEDILYLQEYSKKLQNDNQTLSKSLAAQKERMEFLEQRWDEYMSTRFRWYKPGTWF